MTTAQTKRSRAKRPKPSPDTKGVRVAAYARISVADRDQSAFTSIEAQVEAVGAHIASRKPEGWTLVGEPYVDDGFSGATANRPALERLLRDAQDGAFDMVVVHRFDRFSRSQRDFLNLLHVLDELGIAFASVSQQFDTSTPMGRCMLGVMTAFAQMERETIAERTATKMQAARRKGLWTGGRPPLGYDLVEKALVVNEAEAARVRAAFDLYLELRSLIDVAEELNRRGWTTKSWTTNQGIERPGRAFTKSSVRDLVRNPVYCGRVRAGDALVPGTHEAIVDIETWEAVQRQLAANSASASRARQPRSSSMLAGLVTCGRCGAGMHYQSTTRGGRRYEYLVCGTASKRGASACPGSRLVVAEMEQWIVEQLRTIGRDPALASATIEACRERLATRVREIEDERGTLSARHTQLAAERERLLEHISADPDAPGALKARLGEVVADLEAIGAQVGSLEAEVRTLEEQDLDEHGLLDALRSFLPVWNELWPAERSRVVRLLLERLTFHPDAGDIEIELRPCGIRALASEAGPAGGTS